MTSPIFPAIDIPYLKDVPLPSVQTARLRHPAKPALKDIEAAVAEALAGSRRLAGLQSGARVAVAVGSRGIADIARIARATVAWLKDKGFAPFIVPAMGSHGGGTAEGQKGVLAKLGITEESVGAPVRATMEVVDYGLIETGVRSKLDRFAAEADAIVPIARVKSHTSFDRPIESGLTKMVAVGLGKAEGARNVHILGRRGLDEILERLAARAVENAPLARGIAVVENAMKEIVHLEGVDPEGFAEADQRLLEIAKSLLGRLPFDQIDVLIVERLGKDVSGAGMDYAVIGRTDIRGIDNPPTPFVHKLGVLDMTEATSGNGIGIGCADYMPRAMANALDLEAMYMNSITATFIEKSKIPLVLKDEEAVVRACLATCWRTDPESARYCQIRSTSELDHILVSPSLLEAARPECGIEPLDDPAPLEFETGRLARRVAKRG